MPILAENHVVTSRDSSFKTSLYHQDSFLTLSSDDVESVKELCSPLVPERVDPKLLSELVDTREVRPESKLSKSIPETRSVLILSVLGLSELMNDISVSHSGRSPKGFALCPLPLENGDLHIEMVTALVIFFYQPL